MGIEPIKVVCVVCDVCRKEQIAFLPSGTDLPRNNNPAGWTYLNGVKNHSLYEIAFCESGSCTGCRNKIMDKIPLERWEALQNAIHELPRFALPT